MPRKPRRADLLNTVFGRWTVIDQVAGAKGGARWACRCSCGTERVVLAKSLVSGASKSCGCHRVAELKARPHNEVHGMRHHPAYYSWRGMKSRCSNPKDQKYRVYGGRGIKFDSKWDRFEDFWADMGSTWEPGLTLEREDVNGDYCAANCRWASKLEQARNKQRSMFVLVNGRMEPIAVAEAITGIKAATLASRIKAGWPAEKVATKPVRKITRPATATQPYSSSLLSSVGRADA